MPQTPDTEQQLIERLRAYDRSRPYLASSARGTRTLYPRINPDGPEAADRIEANHARIAELEGLISEESIKAIADDIAGSIVEPRPDVVAIRHSAMVRLGARLRKPLKCDRERALKATGANHD